MADQFWNLPYPSQRQPVMASNMVATSQPLAAQGGVGLRRAGADDPGGMFPAESPATFRRLATGARRNVPLAPTDPVIVVPHLDNDRLEFSERPIRQDIRADQRKANPPQRELPNLFH